MPAWVAVFGRVFFGERLSVIVRAGLVVGLIGVAILVAPTGAGTAIDPGGLAAVLFSPISWSLGSLYSSHRATLPHRPLVAASLQMLFGGVVLAALAIATGELGGFSIGAVSRDSWLAFAYLVTVGSLIGYTTYGWLLRVAPLPKIATYAYVNPVVAFVLGAILLGEEFSVRTFAAAVVIVAAVALIVTARSRSVVAESDAADRPTEESSDDAVSAKRGPRPRPSEGPAGQEA
jgi:drug/metabolite transporter (DMT)-like permease